MKLAQDFVDYRQVVEEAGDAIIASDSHGLITLWNAAATRIFGHSRDSAMGQSLDMIIPDRHRKRHWTGYEATMASGTTRYGTTLLKVPAVHKDGRTLSIAFTVTMLKSEGKVTQVVAFVRDETARWSEERDLRRRLKALEEASGQPGSQNDG